MYPQLIYGALKSCFPVNYTSAGTGGTTSARYCYAVWLRHLVGLRDAGIVTAHGVPRTVVELGPGDSIGTGLAALLSGAERYIALDVLPFARQSDAGRIFQELVRLFIERARIPGHDEFPRLHPRVTSWDFPSDLLTEERLSMALASDRLASIATSLAAALQPDAGRIPDQDASAPVRYVCPWQPDSVEPGAADMVLSQAVLEDIDCDPSRRDVLSEALSAMARWLRPGGVMSHQIDFSHPLGREWNAHWRIGDSAWRLARGRRPYYYNRLSLSAYEKLLDRAGFRVVAAVPVPGEPSVPREALAPRFRHLPATDLVTSGVHLMALKR